MARLWLSVFGFGRLGSATIKLKKNLYMHMSWLKRRSAGAGQIDRTKSVETTAKQICESVKSFCIVRIGRPAENSIQLNRQQIAVNLKSLRPGTFGLANLNGNTREII